MNALKRVPLAGYLIVMLITLSGCGGSTSDSSSPKSNVTFSVNNKTATAFRSVAIQNGPTGDVVYETPLSCDVNQTGCMVYYAGPAFSHTAVLSFKDEAGLTVAYYDTASAPGNYVPAEVTRWTTGAYLYEALVNWVPEVEAMSQTDVGFRWLTFTQNYPVAGSGDDTYEQLAAYYAYQQSLNNPNIASFTNALAQRLIASEAAQRGEFQLESLPARSMMLLGTSGSTGCPPGVNSLIAIAAQMVGEKYFSKLLKPVAKEIGKAGADACKPKDGTSAKLDTIINALNNLQNSVDNLQNDLGKLSNFVANAQMDTNVQSFDDVTADMLQLSKNFEVIRSNEKVGSLKEYVVMRGGAGADALRITLEKDGVGSVFESIVSRISSTSEKNYLLQIASLTGPKFNTLIRALDMLCANPSIGDILALRSQCNMVIGTTLSRMVSVQTMAETLAAQTYDLFEAYPSEATRYGYDLSKTAAEHKALLAAKFATQAESIANSYKSSVVNSDGTQGFYNLFNGFSQALMENLNQVDCFDREQSVPRISGWIKEPGNEYLITNCLTSSTIPVQSRYYWRVNNSDVTGREDVMNMLGVLVPYRFAYNNLSGGNSWYRNLENAPSSATTKINMLAFRSAAHPLQGTFSHSPFWATRMNAFRTLEPGVSENQKIIDYVYDNRTLRQEDPNTIYPYVYPWFNNALNAKELPLLTLFSQGEHTGSGFNLFRFTDKSAYSYVFIQFNVANHDKLICLMGECTGGAQFDGLSFKNGPQKLGVRDADYGSNRKLFGWWLDGKFIDAK